MKKSTLILIALVTLFASTAFTCKKDGYDKSDWWTGHYTTKNPKRTAKGVTVYSYESVTQNNLDKVDEGLSRVFNIASRVYGYQNGLNFADYRIVLFKRSALCNGSVAGFAVRADNYDGSEYDKDPRPGYGVVCAAGLSAEFNRPLAVIVQDDAVIAEATRYEGEHLLAYYNDREFWAATLTHTTGGHPLLVDEKGNLTDDTLRGGGQMRGVTMVLPEEFEVESESEKITLPKGAKVCLLLTK